MSTTERPVSTPVLIGRDTLLAHGRRRAEAASRGEGQLLFLAGEAGIGKTRLLGSIGRGAGRLGMRVVRGAASPRDTEIAGGLLLDLGHALTRGSRSDERETGEHLLERLQGELEQPDDRQRHHRRRLLVIDLAGRIATLGEAAPTMLALEDLHWADDLTLEVLGQLARRLPSLPMLVVGTYRSDELYPRVPMREWRARLITQRRAEETKLARLDLDQTAAMASLLLGGPLPAERQLVEALHARSDGIPLHVEEILAAMALRRPGSESVGTPPVPDTLTDAILRRRSELSTEAAAAADAAAVIGRSFDLDLLATVLERPPEAVSDAVAALQARYFIVPSAAFGWFEFRHALIRDALEQAIPLARRRALHGRIARGAAQRPELADDAFLAAHFEAAGASAEAYRHALVAAERAVVLSAHREALDLYRRALRSAPVDLEVSARAALLAARAAEEAATDDNTSAAESYAEARRLLLADGRSGPAADLVPRLVAARHLLGDDLDARVALLRQGLQEVRAGREGDRVAGATEGRLEAGLSAAYMLDRRLDESIEHGRRAIAAASASDDEETRLNAQTTLGSVFVFAGRMDEGWAMLADVIDRARHRRLEPEAARAYRMAGSAASVLVEYDLAERYLHEGIEYAERTEQWNDRHYMAAHLGHVLWAVGAWEEATRVTQQAMADGRGGITTRITALHTLGFLAMGRGAWEEASTILGEALELGLEMRELQRFSPARWGLAEAASLQGRHEEAIEHADAGRDASAAMRDAAYLFPFLLPGTRARLALGDVLGAERWASEVTAALCDRSIPGTLPAIDHARGLIAMARGSTGVARRALAVARDGWSARRRAWEACAATVDLARCAARANRPAEAATLLADAAASAERMGAVPILSLVREIESGLRRRGVVDEPWAPLTAREFEVASLIAEGRTNRQIAEALTITPKTVASHVEHILARLGAERRTEIAAWVASVRNA